MEAIAVYRILEKDFVIEGMEDIWFKYMGVLDDYICDNFQQRSMGVVCNFADVINKVYTAVFPTYEVMEKVIKDQIKDAMLFVHHPSNWDIRRKPAFYLMNQAQLKIFKERNISVFCFHVPLDNFSQYSTSVTLANQLGIKIIEPFASSRGALNGVIGEVSASSPSELNKNLSYLLGHTTKLYNYGENKIVNKKVGIIAGGGNEIKYIKELMLKGITTFITGITSKSYKEVHQYAKTNKMNLIGGTHYSTEKYSCIKMVDYFIQLGLKSEFIEGIPILEDL